PGDFLDAGGGLRGVDALALRGAARCGGVRGEPRGPAARAGSAGHRIASRLEAASPAAALPRVPDDRGQGGRAPLRVGPLPAQRVADDRRRHRSRRRGSPPPARDALPPRADHPEEGGMTGRLAAAAAALLLGATPGQGSAGEGRAAPCLILHDWFGSSPAATPTYVRDHLEFLESQPFDGLAIYVRTPDLSLNVT